MEYIDVSSLIASRPVVGALIWISIKVVKPLCNKLIDALKSHGKAMEEHLKENTEEIRAAREAQERAADHNIKEHSAMLKGLEILTETILTTNGSLKLPQKKKQRKETD